MKCESSNGLPGNNTTLTLSDVFGEVRTRLHLKADMPVPVVSNWKDVGDFRFAMNRYGKKKTTSELITRMDNLIETIESRFSRIDEIIGERDFRSQVGPVVADVGTMASQAGFERYLTFISIVFAVFISLWVQPIFTLYKDAMTIREVSVVFFDWKTVQAVLIFNILICLWWWYGVFLGRMDPAHSFYKYGFDFMTFSSFAITFRNWDHVNVFPIVVIIASALMAIRFGLTLKNWENDRGQTKPDSAKKALRRFLVVLGIYLLIATGAAGVLLLDPSSGLSETKRSADRRVVLLRKINHIKRITWWGGSTFRDRNVGFKPLVEWPDISGSECRSQSTSLATEEGSFDSKVGYGISVLLLIGISATISAVYLTEGMTWSQPRAWYKPPITPPADETDTGASSGE